MKLLNLYVLDYQNYSNIDINFASNNNFFVGTHSVGKTRLFKLIKNIIAIIEEHKTSGDIHKRLDRLFKSFIHVSFTYPSFECIIHDRRIVFIYKNIIFNNKSHYSDNSSGTPLKTINGHIYNVKDNKIYYNEMYSFFPRNCVLNYDINNINQLKFDDKIFDYGDDLLIDFQSNKFYSRENYTFPHDDWKQNIINEFWDILKNITYPQFHLDEPLDMIELEDNLVKLFLTDEIAKLQKKYNEIMDVENTYVFKFIPGNGGACKLDKFGDKDIKNIGLALNNLIDLYEKDNDKYNKQIENHKYKIDDEINKIISFGQKLRNYAGGIATGNINSVINITIDDVKILYNIANSVDQWSIHSDRHESNFSEKLKKFIYKNCKIMVEIREQLDGLIDLNSLSSTERGMISLTNAIYHSDCAFLGEPTNGFSMHIQQIFENIAKNASTNQQFNIITHNYDIVGKVACNSNINAHKRINTDKTRVQIVYKIDRQITEKNIFIKNLLLENHDTCIKQILTSITNFSNGLEKNLVICEGESDFLFFNYLKDENGLLHLKEFKSCHVLSIGDLQSVLSFINVIMKTVQHISLENKPKTTINCVIDFDPDHVNTIENIYHKYSIFNNDPNNIYFQIKIYMWSRINPENDQVIGLHEIHELKNTKQYKYDNECDDLDMLEYNKEKGEQIDLELFLGVQEKNNGKISRLYKLEKDKFQVYIDRHKTKIRTECIKLVNIIDICNGSANDKLKVTKIKNKEKKTYRQQDIVAEDKIHSRGKNKKRVCK